MATTNNLAHFGITGQKKGLRRFQSYQTAPTRSGMVGQEVGEAAEQAQRHSERDEKEAKRQANAEKRLAKRKKRWSKSYKGLERHAEEFSNRELQYALDHLRIKNTIRQERLSALSNATFNGSKTLKNVADASKSVVGIYNVIAGGYNAYAKYKKTDKEIPFWMTGPKEKKKGGGGGGGNAEHSSMSANEYIAHFGVTGQKKGLRRFQSYETAPTRSGMVGEEVGEAAKQAARLAKQEEKDNKYKDRLIKESDKYYSRAESWHEARSSKFRKKASKTENEKRIAKFTNKAEAAEKKLRNVEKLHKYANESIRNMTHEEIKKEKVQRGIDTLSDIGGIMMGIGMRMIGAPVAVYMYGTGDLRKEIRRDNNAQKYYQKKYGKKMEFEHSNMSADDYIAHFGVPGQQWFKRHFQSYKTAPTRSGKVGVEVGLAAKQAERNGEGVDTDEVFKKEIAEYKDLVNKKLIETEHDVGWRDKMSKDHRDSVDLGMNALERMGRYDFGFEEHYRDETEDNKQFLRDWFVFEDQTIGMFTIANMVRKGATKQQINRIIDTAEEAYDSKFNEETGHYESKHGEEYEYLPGIFQLAEGNWDDRLRSFANACLKEYDENKTEYFKVVGPQKKKLL